MPIAPTPLYVWETQLVEFNTNAEAELLAEGWEPISVTTAPGKTAPIKVYDPNSNTYTPNGETETEVEFWVLLRRQVERTP